MPNLKLAEVRNLPKGVATHRSIVVRGRPIFCWRKLSKAQRQSVEANSRPEFMDYDLIGRVLDEKSARTNARKK